MKRFLLPVVALVLSSCDKEMKRPVHQIPPGYEGFVMVVFGQPGFPELPTNWENQFLEYPADGILITSSDQQFGLMADQVVETTARAGDDRIRKAGKATTYETGGSVDRGGLRMTFLVKAIGSDAYWKSRNRTDYKAKLDEAEQKLRRLSKQGEAAAEAEVEKPAK